MSGKSLKLDFVGLGQTILGELVNSTLPLVEKKITKEDVTSSSTSVS